MKSAVYLLSSRLYDWANQLRDVARALPADVPVAPKLTAIVEQISQAASAQGVPDASEADVRLPERTELDTSLLVGVLNALRNGKDVPRAESLVMQALHLPASPLDSTDFYVACGVSAAEAATYVRKNLSAVIAAERLRDAVFKESAR